MISIPDSAALRRLGSLALSFAVTSIAVSCAGGPSVGGGPDAGADERVWRALERPRPQPLDGAVRVTVSEILVVQATRWGMENGGATAGLTISELVSAGLLRRRDVHFVERRRFAEAAERVRRGLSRPLGAPAVGQSPGAEFFVTGAWAPAGTAASTLDLRLTRVETGEVVSSWRVQTPPDADPTSLARAITGSLMDQLAAMNRRPSWSDPLEGTTPTAPPSYQPTDVPVGAAVAFARGVMAEDDYRWEAARRAYQAALDVGEPSFFEADVALARVARLRAGGTLGANE